MSDDPINTLINDCYEAFNRFMAATIEADEASPGGETLRTLGHRIALLGLQTEARPLALYDADYTTITDDPQVAGLLATLARALASLEIRHGQAKLQHQALGEP